MKKIVALGAAAALVGALFAAEPASNPSLVEFKGNASVQWGVDLDAGKTGFKNGVESSVKFKLFDAGNKSTAADGDIWAELVVKVDDKDSCGAFGDNNGAFAANAAAIDKALLHFYDFYVGILAGDTTVGVVDFTTALRSTGVWYEPARWLPGRNVAQTVAPANGKDYTQGIVAGFENSNLNVAVDFRSLDYGQYTDAYAVKFTAALKDSNEFVPGLKAGIGASYDISDFYYCSNGSAAADTAGATAVKKGDDYAHTLAYAANVGYKFKIDDKFYVYPQAGINGTLGMSDNTAANAASTVKGASNENIAVAALLFGWGDTAGYGSTGLHFFGDNTARGLTPGLSVLAYIPLAETSTTETTVGSTTTKSTTIDHDALQVLLVPAFYSGDLIKNFKAGIYSEIGLFNKDYKQTVTGSTTDGTTETFNAVANEKDAFAFAIAAGLSYDLKLNDDAITVTPKASVRFVNEAYKNRTADIRAVLPVINQYGPADGKYFFMDDYGIQGVNNKDFLNISGSVDVAGLINNTTFSVTYVSANLLNDRTYDDPTYNVKAGTLNVGCKIAF